MYALSVKGVFTFLLQPCDQFAVRATDRVESPSMGAVCKFTGSLEIIQIDHEYLTHISMAYNYGGSDSYILLVKVIFTNSYVLRRIHYTRSHHIEVMSRTVISWHDL